MTTNHQPQAQPDPFALIGLALEAIGEHDTSRDCDTPEIARALGYLVQAREQLRTAQAQRELPSDPDAHVRFTSVCCGARIYRCAVLDELGQLPSKPLVSQGEATCRTCGAELTDAA